MEGAGLHALADPARPESTAQLSGRLPGEREGEGVLGLGGIGEDAMSDTSGEHPGLARPGARDHRYQP